MTRASDVGSAPRASRAQPPWTVLPLVLAACTTTPPVRFGPSPQEHEIALAGEETPVARVQVSSLGVEALEEDAQADGVSALHFRLRVENPRSEPLRLDEEAFQLLDAELDPFGDPRVSPLPPADDLALGPGEAATFALAFPFPREADEPADEEEPSEEKAMDLSSVHLRFGIVHGERTLTAGALFHRLHRAPPYDPYYDAYGPYWYDPSYRHPRVRFGLHLGHGW